MTKKELKEAFDIDKIDMIRYFDRTEKIKAFYKQVDHITEVGYDVIFTYNKTRNTR